MYNTERRLYMLAVNYSTIRNNLKDYCDKVTNEEETVIVTRKDEKNVVILSMAEYNRLTKAEKNAAYLKKIDRAISQLSKDEGAAIDDNHLYLLKPDASKTPALGRLNGTIIIPDDFKEPLDEMKEYMH